MQPLADAARSRSRGRLAGRHQRHARDDGVQLARRRLLPDHRRPRADADAGRSWSSARRRSASIRAARLLGGARHLRRRRPASTTGKWFDEKWKKNDDDPDARADRLWDEADAAGDRRRSARQAGHASPRRPSPARRAAPLLYDLTTLQREANGRFGFSRQDHAVARAGAVREAQGADLSAHRLARAARGLPRRRSRRRWRCSPRTTCPARCARWRAMPSRR